ncbi:MAG: hypothetical protein AAGC64_09095 [Bacteroidota bacterium]
MKKTFIILGAICIGFFANAQKAKQKDIIGTWKLIIDIEEEMKEEVEEADTMLEEVLINTISGFVSGIMEDVEIYFDFRKNNKVKIMVYAYDEEETEYGSWFINQKGYLEIKDIDNDDNFSVDSDEWRLMDGILVNDKNEQNHTVYMTKVD